MADKLDGHFSSKDYVKYSFNGSINLSELINSDTVLKKQMEECYTSTNKTLLMNAEGFQQKILTKCYDFYLEKYGVKVDKDRLRTFCQCQVDLIKSKKITDSDFENINNPNSLTYYQFYYNCNHPFIDKDSIDRNWNVFIKNDVDGPEADTIKILNFKGMTFVKIKIGNNKQVWLFDSGASDLLINKETEEELKKQGIINKDNFLGISEYEMANGTIDSCRTYRINNLQIGHFKVNNVIVAASDKAKKLILGRSVMNKFTRWTLNNENSTLIFTK
ncbi:MAG: retropepsin-like aspartic protease [Bacteroidetes bacterium]|nr:retropepsin-like aspartic protease [Bacteroidota bacterium]